MADALEEEAQASSAAAGAGSNEQLMELAQELHTLTDRKDELAAEEKSINERLKEIKETLLPDLMRKLKLVHANKGSFTFVGGKVHLETKLYASVETKPSFFAWLRKNKAADLIQETVNAQTLSAFVRERRENKLQDPPFLKINEITAAKLTRSK